LPRIPDAPGGFDRSAHLNFAIRDVSCKTFVGMDALRIGRPGMIIHDDFNGGNFALLFSIVALPDTYQPVAILGDKFFGAVLLWQQRALNLICVPLLEHFRSKFLDR
jgi:hypothetical protein